jgi:hypothetical protein
MQNLGELLKSAGVKGAKVAGIPLVGGSRQQDFNPEKIALSRLPEEFSHLRACSDGRVFVRDIRTICTGLSDSGKTGLIDQHVVYGLSQLAHERRDALAGSKRSSFTNFAIPCLLKIKEAVSKGRTTGLCDWVVRLIDEWK